MARNIYINLHATKWAGNHVPGKLQHTALAAPAALDPVFQDIYRISCLLIHQLLVGTSFAFWKQAAAFCLAWPCMYEAAVAWL